MLGVIYAYTEEYKHNNCFLKYVHNAQYVQNFIKLKNVSDLYICREMNGFFSTFS